MTVVNELDPRLLRVSFQIGNQLKRYEGLAITASGTKYANANQNECEVKISNLDRTTHDYLLTETSPFKQTADKKMMIVEAGRVSTGYALVFAGDITNSVGAQPPDVTLTLKAATGDASKGQIIAASQAGTAPLQTIAAKVAQGLGLTLNFQATPKQISNYSFTGSAVKQVEQLGNLGRVNAYVDDQTLIIKNFNTPLAGRMRVLSADSGMVGIPEFTEQGIKVKMLFDNQTVLGGGLQIMSKQNPAANGVYSIFKLGFELANRDTPFYYIAEGARVNG